MAFHPLGTARADARPEHGVVNGDLRLHDMENVWVADASVIPSSIGVNPQITIMALATRLAYSLLGQAGAGRRAGARVDRAAADHAAARADGLAVSRRCRPARSGRAPASVKSWPVCERLLVARLPVPHGGDRGEHARDGRDHEHAGARAARDSAAGRVGGAEVDGVTHRRGGEPLLGGAVAADRRLEPAGAEREVARADRAREQLRPGSFACLPIQAWSMIFGLAMKTMPIEESAERDEAGEYAHGRKVLTGLYLARRGARRGDPDPPHAQGLRRRAGRPGDARRAVRARPLGAQPPPDGAVALPRARPRGARAAEGLRRARRRAKLDRAPTLVVASVVQTATPSRTRRTCARRRAPSTSCCWGRTRAAWPTTGARRACCAPRRAARRSAWAMTSASSGLIHLGPKRQEQPPPARPDLPEFVTYLP